MIDAQTYLNQFHYCEDLFRYQRRKSREVYVGHIPLGGDNPIRVQSMTIANTRDTEATIEETIQLADAGCDYVRVTAPSKKEAENLQNIKDGLRSRGYNIPLIADIHFTPNAAEIAAQIVDKVRINPGNYADKKRFQVFEFSDEEYEAELERIREKFTPLVELCKAHGTAMRIGTNHGSLSDRIMNRYGDTPEGMVESAMEFLRICEDLDFHDIVLSMKASNPKVMVEAYRMLVAKMTEADMHYPLHLGVTEAGDGEEARIKSAAGIGTLLEDGLGDTIRVSLTEDSVYEPAVVKKLANRYQDRNQHQPIAHISDAPLNIPQEFNPFQFSQRPTNEVHNIGGRQEKRVIADYSQMDQIRELSLNAVEHYFEPGTAQWRAGDHACDYLYLGSKNLAFDPPESLGLIHDLEQWQQLPSAPNRFPLVTPSEYLNSTTSFSDKVNFLKAKVQDLTQSLIEQVKTDPTVVLILESDNAHAFPELRKAFIDLERMNFEVPVIVKSSYEAIDEEAFVLYSATDAGGLFIEGFGNGLWLSHHPHDESSPIHTIRVANRVAFGTLQATGARISKTEFIACPSCGRTQFDLQETTAMVREKTSHLKGIKIAVMGCIVNGPGEMADADYGYVGTGRGKVALYRNKEVVKKNLESYEALDELINLIREDGKWIDPNGN